jgi:hypothetical protein
MQQAIFLRTKGVNSQTVASQVLPEHGTGTQTPANNDAPASNDSSYLQQESTFKFALTVLANVVGGSVLLAAMFNLPIILAVIWGL